MPTHVRVHRIICGACGRPYATFRMAGDSRPEPGADAPCAQCVGSTTDSRPPTSNEDPHPRRDVRSPGGRAATARRHAGRDDRHRAGLGDGQQVHSYLPRCLTYRGHDFLEHARDDTTWRKAKDKAASIGGTMTIQTMLMILKQLVAAQIGA